MEKLQMSPHFASPMLQHNGSQERIRNFDKPTTVLSKKSSQVPPTQLLAQKESNDADVTLNLCPNGSEINISVNETTLRATKSFLTTTIGSFTVNINSTIKQDAPRPSLVPVISAIQGTPLHIVLGNSPDVRATLSLSK